MRYAMKRFIASAAAALCLTLAAAAQSQNPPAVLSARDKQTIAAFDKRLKGYVALRERVEAGMPKLSKDATPEQIEAHKTTLQEKVRAARAGAKPGQFFTPDIAELIRAIARDEFKGRERQELRRDVLVEAENKAVPLRVNYPYPDTQELLEMPPTLLLRLPELPKQVKYRFVGRNMLLVDRENGLIIDYMTDALP
jgi:hypothetical protein